MIFCDNALARRLERAEGTANARFVEARARLFPESGAQWIEVGGTYAMFDAPGSPITQTFGLGVFEDAKPKHLDAIEQFFGERDADTAHEVCPLVSPALVPMLAARGYTPVTQSTVLFLPLPAAVPGTPNPEISTHVAGERDREAWAEAAVEAWCDTPGIPDFIRDLVGVSAECDSISLYAELEGEVIATATLCLHERVALLGGSATVPRARRQGAHHALLNARLRMAEEAGCDLAMMSAEPPGGTSQRNAERQGFRVAYTRTKWSLPAGGR